MYAYFDQNFGAETANAPDGGWPSWTTGTHPGSTLIRVYGGTPNFANLVANATAQTVDTARSANTNNAVFAYLNYLTPTATFRLSLRGGGYYAEFTAATVRLYRGGGVLLATGSWSRPPGWASGAPGAAVLQLLTVGTAIKVKAYAVADGDQGWAIDTTDSAFAGAGDVGVGLTSGSVNAEVQISRIMLTDGADPTVHAVTETLSASDTPSGRTAVVPESLGLSDQPTGRSMQVPEFLTFADAVTLIELTSLIQRGETLSLADAAVVIDLTRWTFSPPTRPGPRTAEHPLWRRINVPYGVGVFRRGGFYRQVEHPGDEDYADATEIYLGGHRYLVSGETATALRAAGYGSYLTPEAT